MKFKDYYKILGVTSNASQEEIKCAYQRLARKFHPDKNYEPNAEQQFKEINEAYNVLKDPQKRVAYASSFKLILPYTYAWFLAKKEAWQRTNAQKRVKKKAGIRAKFLGYSKKQAQKHTHTRGHTIEGNNMKSTNKFSILLMGIFVLVLSAVTIGIIYAVEQFGQWQSHQKIIFALEKGDETAIDTLESSDIDTQRKILQSDHVKKAVIQLYLQRPNPVLEQLELYDNVVKDDLLKDDEVYSILKTHYFHQVESEIKADNFNKALQLLGTLEKRYPNSRELSDKSEKIRVNKQQRLSSLTQRYMECLNQTLAPLLERTHCMAESRQKIENVGIEHTLPSDSNLPTMYTKEIKRALAEKKYKHAEKVLLDWQNLLPSPSKKREVLRQNLALHQQTKNIVADLRGSNNTKIVKRLSQLTTDKILQKEVLANPQIQNNLLRYHLKELLTLMTNKDSKIKVHPKNIVRIEQLLAKAHLNVAQQSDKPNLQPSYFSTETSQVAILLKECKMHYKAKRLTTGKPGTALGCYKAVLKKEPNNREALKGLKSIENRYKTWAENAFQQNKLNKVKSYLAGLKKVNPKSPYLAKLTRRLDKTETTSTLTETTSTLIEPYPVQPSIKPTQQIHSPPAVSNNHCEECNCSALLRQLSMGVKPLTSAEETFFQNQCR
ncbi:DnaJ domain-containing protein [Candidatus Parabeggiatoa sp. HSG14]|uniref:DnaJ domain-containing protein n=1 Tax=Candidatus Parabeggiatoa sp. HSG14 TaxID=3055593 RepID=UPI0032E3BAA5